MDKGSRQKGKVFRRRGVQAGEAAILTKGNMDLKPKVDVKSSLLGSYRLGLAVLLLLASAAILFNACQLAFAMVCMLDTPLFLNSSESLDNSTKVIKEFDWDLPTQGKLHTAGFFGLVLTQFVSGWATNRIPGGGKWLLVSSAFVMGLIGVVCPMAARHSVDALFWLRLINGMAMGVALPAFLPLMGAWAVPREQGLLLAIAFSGFSISNCFVNVIAAFLCQYAGGWPTIFYVFGGLSLAWSFLGAFLVYDKPEKHPFISQKEKLYLSTLNPPSQSSKDAKTPWKEIFTCIPLWSLIVTNLFHFGAFLTLGMFLPNYLRDALGFPTEENGIMSSVPSFAALGAHFAVGPLFDWIRTLNICSLTAQRKIFNSIGSFVPALALVCAAFLSSDSRYAAVAIISVAHVFSEFAIVGGYAYAFLDIAPQYAGLLQGVSNTFGAIPGFVLPPIISAMVPHGTVEEWSLVLLLLGALLVVAGIVFIVLFSSEQLSWAKHASSHKRNEKRNGSAARKFLSS